MCNQASNHKQNTKHQNSDAMMEPSSVEPKKQPKQKTKEEMLASLALSITNMQSSIDNLLQKSDNNTASINELKATNEKGNSELNTKIDDFLA